MKRETTADFFKRVIVEVEKAFDKDEWCAGIEYDLADRDASLITDNDFEIIAIPSIGGSEGYYVDVYIKGFWNEECQNKRLSDCRKHIGTCKTLLEGIEGAFFIGKLAGAIIYLGEKVLYDHPEIYECDEWQKHHDVSK